MDEVQRFMDLSSLAPLQRAYFERLTSARLHQPVFRARVLQAYGERCAMCRLHQAQLLDTAHIIPDGQPKGDPVIPNGLALCKIHHAAYDVNLIGYVRISRSRWRSDSSMTSTARCSATAYKRWPADGSFYLAIELPSPIRSGWNCATSSSRPRADELDRLGRAGHLAQPVAARR